MGGKLSRVAAAVGVVASIWVAGPAHAACVGTQQTAGVCVTVKPGDPWYEDCIYLVSSTCTPVSVPGFDVSCGGWVGDQGFVACA